MDPASFSFAVITAFKEVYLLSKFVCNTLTSVSNYKSEQRELATEFFLEFTYTRSFGRLFLQGLGMNADDAQNTVSKILTYANYRSQEAVRRLGSTLQSV